LILRPRSATPGLRADGIPEGNAAALKDGRWVLMYSRQVSILALFVLVASVVLLCSEAAAQNQPPAPEARMLIPDLRKIA